MYSFSVTRNEPVDAAIERLRAVLQAHHLGIVSDVDVQKILQAKLGEDIPPYRILGACNPGLAKRVVTADPAAGTLLPCNIVVRGEGEGTVIHFMDPEPVLALADHPELAAVAREAKEILQQVAAELAG